MINSFNSATHSNGAMVPLHSENLRNNESKNKFQYLYFNLTKSFLAALSSSPCDCAAVAAKIFILALPIICLLEGCLDLAALPWIWMFNQLCRNPTTTQEESKPLPELEIHLPPIIPAAPIPTDNASREEVIREEPAAELSSQMQPAPEQKPLPWEKRELFPLPPRVSNYQYIADKIPQSIKNKALDIALSTPAQATWRTAKKIYHYTLSILPP